MGAALVGLYGILYEPERAYLPAGSGMLRPGRPAAELLSDAMLYEAVSPDYAQAAADPLRPPADSLYPGYHLLCRNASSGRKYRLAIEAGGAFALKAQGFQGCQQLFLGKGLNDVGVRSEGYRFQPGLLGSALRDHDDPDRGVLFFHFP